MARAPDERVSKAHDLYKQGFKLVEIASQLNVPDGTVRRWKSTYKWDCERSKNKSERSGKKNKVKKEAVVKEVKQVLDNTELTDKQRLFCLYYTKSFNATKSYQKAYGCSYATALTEGPALKNSPRISSEIERLKRIKLTDAHFEPGDVFQKYMDIAFSDITDYVQIDNGYSVSLKNDIDGSIVDSISSSENGIKIKLADRMKALQWLAEHMDLATEEQKARIAVLKSKADSEDEEEITDDGFLEALNSTAGEDWSDEE